ncbi:MAG: type II toxin-antitoxin system VapB family antitoxin [Chloroflexota bacterium]
MVEIWLNFTIILHKKVDDLLSKRQIMALNIKNDDVEKLLNELVKITGETKTQAVKKALEERRARLKTQQEPHRNAAYILAFLQDEIWSQIPQAVLGQSISKNEIEAILGYGDEGI